MNPGLLTLLFGASGLALIASAAAAKGARDAEYIAFLLKIEPKFYPWVPGFLYGMAVIGARKQGMSFTAYVNREVKAGVRPIFVYRSLAVADLMNIGRASWSVVGGDANKTPTLRQAALDLLTSIEGGSASKAEARIAEITKIAKSKGLEIDWKADVGEYDLLSEPTNIEAWISEALGEVE